MWLERINSPAEALVYFGVVFWIGGRAFRESLRASLRFFPLPYLVAATAIPVGIALIVSAGNYLFHRAVWAEHEFGNQAAPLFTAYVSTPDPWLLLLFFSALFEEIVFRGFLRMTLVLRYGLYRGIFLTGIIWAAFHFVSDASRSRTVQAWSLQFGIRIGICLALNFVFCWLTLKSGSVFPAAIAHTVYNVLVVGKFGSAFTGEVEILIALWSVVAILLFKYWPVQTPYLQSESAIGPTPEPAT